MRILRLYTRLPPLLGGMENHIAQLTKAQILLGHDVTVYFNLGSKVSVNDVRVSRIPLSQIKPQFIGVFFYYFLTFFRLIFNSQKFDLVHIHGDWSSLIFSRLIKKIVKAEKLCMTIHDELSSNRLSKKALGILIKHVDVIFVTGHAIAQQLKKLTDKEIIIQPSGVNNIFFKVRERTFHLMPLKIIIVSNLVKKKNLGLVLDIAKKLPLFSFLIVGDGPEKKYLEDRVKYEKIDNINMIGYKTSNELHFLYYQADIFLIVSIKEGTPTAMLEAMVCGLPVISSGAGGVKNILQSNHCIVENNKKESYVSLISELAKDVSKLKNISINNRLLASSLSWENVAKNIDTSIIEDLKQ
jgi:L-malate glycosyltransferase